MRKIVVVGAATLGLLGTWVATAGPNGPNDNQPQARAYFTVPFGGAKHSIAEPLHYGLRLDYDSHLRATDGSALPALANFDFDTRGNRLALVGGVPFAGRVATPPMRQNEGDSPSPTEGGGSGGFTFFDWGLLAVGLGGVGYAIYKISESKDSPDPPAGTTTGATTGATTGVVTGAVNAVTGVVTGAVNAVTGVLTGTTGFTGTRSVEGVLPFDPVDNRDNTYQQWLDGGTGHMGDLKPQ